MALVTTSDALVTTSVVLEAVKVLFKLFPLPIRAKVCFSFIRFGLLGSKGRCITGFASTLRTGSFIFSCLRFKSSVWLESLGRILSVIVVGEGRVHKLSTTSLLPKLASSPVTSRAFTNLTTFAAHSHLWLFMSPFQFHSGSASTESTSPSEESDRITALFPN